MVELDQVCKQYGSEDRTPVLTGVSLKISPHSVAVVTGKTGTGKTTLIRLLTAMTPADSGTITVFDRDIARLRASSVTMLRRRIGILPQNLELVDDWTALRNVALPLEISGTHPRAAQMRAAELLGALNLASTIDQIVGGLSRGEKQRIGLARAFVHEPWLVALDEPSAHLDSVGVRQIGGLLAQCISNGGAALVTTSDPRLVSVCLRHHYQVFRLAGGQLRSHQTSPTHIRKDSPQLPIPNVVPFPVAQAGARE